ncbi:MAG TPA: hypothetical protein VHG09_00535 [Longimicrobiales bacterium]|nr:hypothetical protein [Longimicrobiales bacterium]
MMKRTSRLLAYCAALTALMPVAGSGQSAQELEPQGAWAAQTEPSTIVLSWRAAPDVTLYHIYCASGTDPVRRIGSPASNTTRWILQVRPQMIGVEQRCEIEAQTSRGLSERVAFNPVVPERGGPAPTAPGVVTAKQTAPAEISVNWDAAPNATAYFIARAAGKEGYRIVCQLCPTTAEYIDRDVAPGMTYSYAVAAVTAGGTSRRANSAVITVDAEFGLASADDDSAPRDATPPATDVRDGTPRPRGSLTATPGGTPNPRGTSTSGTPGGTPNPRGTSTPRTPGGTPRGTSGTPGGTANPPSTTTTTNPTPEPEPPRPCVLEYQRADNMWAAIGRPDGPLGTERLTLQRGQRRAFVTDWQYEKLRNDGSNYYGSHGRVVTNAGQTEITLTIKGVVRKGDLPGTLMGNVAGAGAVYDNKPFLLAPGMTVQLKADLVEASCVLKGAK